MWHLENFSDEQLIDIVKNYKSYRYEITVKYEALAILKNRGITEEDLLEANTPKGQLNEHKKDLLADFKRNSAIAFGLYFALLIFQFFVTSYLTLAIFGSLLVFFFAFIILSFIAQRKFYKLINLPNQSPNPVLFFLVGTPFYPIFYWFTLKEMKKYLF